MNRAKPYLLFAVGLLLAAVCWIEFAYRIHLYYLYDCNPFVNHVADGYFGIMHGLAASAGALFVTGLFVAGRQKNVPRVIVYSCGMVVVIAFSVALWYVRQNHILVTYGEFVKNLGAFIVPPKEPLHRAVLEGNLVEVQKLIDQGVDVNKFDEGYDCTALHLAAMHGHLDIAKALRKAGALIYVENKRKEPLVFAAVHSGHVDMLKFLLDEGASSESRNADGENLIHRAITWRQKDMVLYLIKVKVDVNARDKNGYAPLHTAAWIGDLRVTADLVNAGANVNATTNREETPLHVAASYDHVQVVEDLLAAKADCNLLDESGCHPLFLTKSVKIMDLLLKAGAKPDISDRYGYTPLSGAVVTENGKERAMRLIQGGADVNKRIDHGRTAVFNVIPGDKVEIFALLVENGANLNIKSDSGETPLDWVQRYKAEKIRAFLEERDMRRKKEASNH